MATGSEVQIAVKARELLQAEGIGTRVVSVPCLDWFEVQDAAYIESVLPAAVTARVSVEAGIAQPWWRWLGSAGKPVSLEHYGASADAATLFREFGFTPEATVEAAKASLAAAGKPARASAPRRTPRTWSTSAATPARRPNPARRTTDAPPRATGDQPVPTGLARTEPAPRIKEVTS